MNDRKDAATRLCNVLDGLALALILTIALAADGLAEAATLPQLAAILAGGVVTALGLQAAAQGIRTRQARQRKRETPCTTADQSRVQRA